MKNKLKFAVAALMPVAAFAEGSTPTMDTTTATQILTSAQTGLSGLFTSVSGVIGVLVLGGLAIWGALALVKIVKRAFKSGS